MHLASEVQHTQDGLPQTHLFCTAPVLSFSSASAMALRLTLTQPTIVVGMAWTLHGQRFAHWVLEYDKWNSAL